MRVGETGWTRRVAARAAEFGNAEVLATATCNLFAHALNARDRDEMRRLRPALLAAITPGASPNTLAVTHCSLAIDAYVDGRWQAASEHAAIGVEQSEALGFAYQLAAAVGTRLLIDSARDESISQPALRETLEVMRRAGVAPLAGRATERGYCENDRYRTNRATRPRRSGRSEPSLSLEPSVPSLSHE